MTFSSSPLNFPLWYQLSPLSSSPSSSARSADDVLLFFLLLKSEFVLGEGSTEGKNLKFFHFCFGRVRLFIRTFFSSLLMNIWDFASDQVTLSAPVNSKINFKCWECDLEGWLRKNGRNLLCLFHNPAENIYDNFINTWYGSLTFHTHVCTALRGIWGSRGVEKRNRQKHNENNKEKVRS